MHKSSPINSTSSESAVGEDSHLNLQSNFNLSNSTSTPSAKSITAVLCCYGIATETQFMQGYDHFYKLPLTIVAACEIDTTLRNKFSSNTECKYSYADMRDFLHDVKSIPDLREDLLNVDILTVTPPCQGRSVLNETRKPYGTDDLFLLQVELAKVLKPKRILAELTPANKAFNLDHSTVATTIQSLGYTVNVTERFQSDLRLYAIHINTATDGSC